jgi:hypothetical protein
VSGEQVVAAVEAALLKRFGPDPGRASVSFVGVERIEVLRWRDGRIAQLSTLGASRHPMSDPTAFHADPIAGPRAEILVRVRDGGERAGESVSDGMVRSLAIVAATPSVEGIVLKPESTIDLGEPVTTGSSCVGFVLRTALGEAADTGAALEDGSAVLDTAQIDTGVPGVEPVALLEAIPVTAAELAWARAKGVPALRERFAIAGVDLMDVRRRAVSLEDPPAR